jgi:hypothetical protein
MDLNVIDQLRIPLEIIVGKIVQYVPPANGSSIARSQHLVGHFR